MVILADRPLTTMQAAFAPEFFKDRNATQAAIRAGYSAKTAHVTGHRLKSDPRIMDRLAVLAQEAGKVAAREFAITEIDIIKELIDIKDRAKKARHFAAAIAALKLLGQTIGMFNDVNINLTTTIELEWQNGGNGNGHSQNAGTASGSVGDTEPPGEIQSGDDRAALR